MVRYHPLRELLKARLREFFREPETIFWVYAFPVLLVIGLGVAFRNRPAEPVFVDMQQYAVAEDIARDLRKYPDFVVSIHSKSECRDRLRGGNLPSLLFREPASNMCTTLHGLKAFLLVSEWTTLFNVRQAAEIRF